MCFRQGLGSSFLPPGETAGQCEPDSLYSSRGLYADELPSSARPRPVGGTTGTIGNCTHADTNCPKLLAMPPNTVGFRCKQSPWCAYMSYSHFRFLHLHLSTKYFHMERQHFKNEHLKVDALIYCLYTEFFFRCSLISIS